MKYYRCLLWCSLLMFASVLAQPTPDTAENDLLRALIEAPDNATRIKMLNANPQLITVNLARGLTINLNAVSRKNEYPKLLELATFSLEVTQRVTSPYDRAAAFNFLGTVSMQIGHYQESLEYFQQAYPLWKQIDNLTGQSQSLENISLIKYHQGKFGEALDFSQQSSAILEKQLAQEPTKQRYLDDYAHNLNGLGQIQTKLNRFECALETFRRALDYAQRATNKREILGSYAGMANVFLDTEKLSEAEEYYLKSLQALESLPIISKDTKAILLSNLGLVYKHQGRYDLSLQVGQESLAIREGSGNAVSIARAKRQIASTYMKLHRYNEVLKLAAEALPALSAEISPTIYYLFLSYQGQALLALQQPLAAEESFLKSIATVEKIRNQSLRDDSFKQSIFEDKLAPYLSMVELKVSQGKMQEALIFAERTKARVLVDLLQTNNDEQPVDALFQQLFSPAILNEQILDQKTALLEYVIAEDKLFLFVITRNSPGAMPAIQVFSTPIAQKDLEKEIQLFRSQLAQRQLTFKATASALYEKLIEQAQESLKDKKSLLIIPDRALWEFPFQALVSRSGQYLIEKYSISYAPSLTVLASLSKQISKKINPASTDNLLAFGNPQFLKFDEGSQPNQVSLSQLPFTESLVKRIKNLYQPQSAQIFIGANATKERFELEANKYATIHLATHGFIDDRNPLQSRFWLASDENSKSKINWVEAQEIMKMKLQAQLVILSACESGRGYVAAGEGVIGFSWAFMKAGCPNTVMSQWQVREDSTTELMVNFHKQLRGTTTKQKFAKSYALQQATIQMIQGNTYKHPFYWAGFVLVGNGS